MAASIAGTALGAAPRIARASCATPANAIEAENCLPGNPASQWDVGAGDTTVEGFATDISVNRGGTVQLKIHAAASYRLDIYRMGYYGGAGARAVASLGTFPARSQPACLGDSTTGLVDCGNWSVAASWAVPANAVSGIYFARVTRTDTGGASHVFFVVRDDASTSAILFQTSDTTWQAYNEWGGASLYVGGTSAGRAYKVSYNRPFDTRTVSQGEDFVWNAEYPMVRWLEANGYDVTYHTGMDADRYGTLIRNHKVWMSNGHDEYWSGAQRTNVESARDLGVNLAFLSGNKIFWKTRWEPSIDGTATAYRTLVCYKETHANAKIDPSPEWTGTWRDPRFSPPSDGGRPENQLGGTIFMINGIYVGDLQVGAEDGKMRIWRNTGLGQLAAGQVATLAPGTLGAEVDVDLDNGFRPAGLFGVSTNAISTTTAYLLDYGSTYGSGTATHRVTLYRAPSGALVFSTGTYAWSWGLDANHDRSILGSTTDVRMQQATVNVLADMGVQAATLQPGLVGATGTTDVTAPITSLTAPLPGANVPVNTPFTISGTASDLGGVVAGVEVSTDGGTTWHPATGRSSWTYTWTPNVSGTTTIRARAVDDSGNLEVAGPGATVTVGGGPTCVGGECTLFALTVPSTPDGGPDSAVELGVQFRSEVAGQIKGIRFYKSSANTGTHVANLWTAAGTLLATATFSAETASGWQRVNFAAPVTIAANTVYVASYHCPGGHYAGDNGYFTGKGVDQPPLHAPANGVSGAQNGVYAYGATSQFPTQNWLGSNYWVDVVFTPTPTATLQSIAVAPANATIQVSATQQYVATGTYSDGTTLDLTSSAAWTSSNAAVVTVAAGGLATGKGAGAATLTATASGISGSTGVTVQAAPLGITTASLPGGIVGLAYASTLAASGGAPPYAWAAGAGLPPGLSVSVSTGQIAGVPTTAGTYAFAATVTDALGATATRSLSIAVQAGGNYTLWPSTAVPGVADGGPDSSVELGLRFTSDAAGYVLGVRFYKAATNTGTHVGSLWTTTGTRLALGTFTGETASGWQEVRFSAPVAIAANTAYLVSYSCPNGHYSDDQNYFASVGRDNAPLHAPASTAGAPNGVYAYGPAGSFPSQTWFATNYWVDVLFTATPPPSLQTIAIAPAAPTVPVGSTVQLRATGTYSDGSTADLSAQATWTSSATAVATVAAGGLAKGVAAGTSTVTAALGAVTGTTVLTVSASPLVVSTAALPGGLRGTSYSATLGASGGVPAYTWLASAGLPPGLSLNAATGVISGTPTVIGAYAFTVTVVDAAGTSASAALSITIVDPTDFTIWPPTSAPVLVDGGPDGSVELGVKFRADLPGLIKGIRFYKAAANTGTHIGSLWSAAGALLGQATFTGETASGWQQVTFATPVAIAANTVYVASYHASAGHYSADQNYFSGKGQDSGYLHALATGVSGGNGTYAYGAAPQFPNSTYLASNYWVDVVFAPSGPPPSLSAIAVTAAAATMQTGTTQQLTATGTFSDGSTRDLTGSATWSSSTAGVVSVSASGLVSAFNAGTTTVTASVGAVSGGTVVTVQAAPAPPPEGPGGPILVVSSTGAPFSRYLAEILKAEGFNAFTLADISLVSPASLASYDVVILGEFPLTTAQVTMFTSWVNGGGSLIAMRPDKQLAGLLGLGDLASALSDAYVRIDTTTAPGQGLVADTIQFHGGADLYRLAGATAVATLYSGATAATSAPAVTSAQAGLGRAAAFTYDLARSVVYTRQGNPAWSGQERDGIAPIRSDDLYYGGTAVDWVDLGKVAIPQADEQQRLLGNLILQLEAGKRPMPRFWYFPSGHKAVVIMTGDDHAIGGTAGRFDDYIASSAPACSIPDWECVRSTSYVYNGSPLTNAQAVHYESLGFEVALHVTTNCGDWTSYANLDGFYTTQLAGFASGYPGIPPPDTNRTHCVVWSDYDSQPQVELAHGIRLDTTYYYWPGSWLADRPGFMTGSGIPMRYAKRTGEVVNVFQAATQMTDESSQTYPLTIDSLLDNAIGVAGYFGAFTANMHTDYAISSGSDAIVASAQARGVPVVSARQMLDWLDARDQSSFGAITWSNGVLSFQITAPAAARNLQAMVPASFGALNLLSLTQAGTPVAFRTQTIKGVSYALFAVSSGAYQATYR